MWDLLGPEIKHVAPMLQGGFLTAGQPGKPVCLLWRNVFCLFFGWEFVLWYWVVWVVCIFCILTSCQSYPLQIFSPILQAIVFISLMVSFVIQKLLSLIRSHTIALISHASKVMCKILQARLQQYVNRELPNVQAGFSKGRETRDQIANICWIIKKSKRVPEKHLFLLSWLCQSFWLCRSQ